MFKINLKLSNFETMAYTYHKPLTGVEFIDLFCNNLKSNALALRINNSLIVDLSFIIDKDLLLEILSEDDEEALEIIRHTSSHILAEAVKEIFPEVKLATGPVIKNGFYYDFYKNDPFSPQDLLIIEHRMKEIINRNEQVSREVWKKEEAISFFSSINESFKVEIIKNIPENESISVYRQGNFVDLCKGPHLPSTRFLSSNCFKLISTSGSYWKGINTNLLLYRIYGTAWPNKEQLELYLSYIDKNKEYDHRKIGKDLFWFHFQEEAQGSVFWHPKGWTVFKTLKNFIRSKIEDNEYVEVNTPQLIDKSLWVNSGHWEKFQDNMFTVTCDDKIMAIKPMNCPGHIQIFKHSIKSYKDLPLRIAEFGSCYRNEPSGSLHGLMRVRSMTQDDAHIFCTPDQIINETKLFCNLLKEVYDELGFSNILIKFSDRPENRVGNEEIWNQAEESLRLAASYSNLKFSLNKGEGAFYGPKLEFILEDSLGREWQCGTLQVDFILPKLLDAYYVDKNGERVNPIILHRAILGSLERFIGILIEHYSGGKLPLWLSPVQVVVSTINKDCEIFAQKVYKELRSKSIRAELDIRNEKIGYKIRDYFYQKIPYVFIIGKKEMISNQVTFKNLRNKNQSESKSLDLLEAIEILKEKIERRIINY